MKLWEKKGLKTLTSVEKFSAGKDYIYDREIAIHDLTGTIAHVKMLNKIGILDDEDTRKITLELEHLRDKWKKTPPNLTIEDEDIHTYIENHLIATLGDVGKKVHTGRSRNDQVITAIRLYEKEKISDVIEKIDRVLKKLTEMSKRLKGKPLIGYTHLRQAMPTTVDMWIGSVIEALEEDRKLLRIVYEFIDKNPLGSSAGYGVPVIKIDRDYTTRVLGFAGLIKNPIYCQNTRGKYEAFVLFALATLLGDLARFASDVIIFSSDEFRFFNLKAEITTGSSIMPHKRNPDVFELVRAKFKKLLGHLVTVMSITFSIMSGYSKDLQETKESVIESFREVESSLEVIEDVMDYLEFDEEAVYRKTNKKIFSTGIALTITNEFKIPFREAYKTVGEIVEEYEKENNTEHLKEKFSDKISRRILELLSMDVKELFRIFQPL